MNKKLIVFILVLVCLFFLFRFSYAGTSSESEAEANAGAFVDNTDNSTSKSTNINIIPPINPALSTSAGQPTLVLRPAQDEVPKYLRVQGWVYVSTNPTLVSLGLSPESVEELSKDSNALWGDKIDLSKPANFGIGFEEYTGKIGWLDYYPTPENFPQLARAVVVQVGEQIGQGYVGCPEPKVVAKIAKELKKMGANYVFVVGNIKDLNRTRMFGLGGVGAGGGTPGGNSALGGVTGIGFADAKTWVDQKPRLMVLGFRISWNGNTEPIIPLQLAKKEQVSAESDKTAELEQMIRDLAEENERLQKGAVTKFKACEVEYQYEIGFYVPFNGPKVRDQFAECIEEAMPLAEKLGGKVIIGGYADSRKDEWEWETDPVNPSLSYRRARMALFYQRNILKERGHLTAAQIDSISARGASKDDPLVPDGKSQENRVARVEILLQGE